MPGKKKYMRRSVGIDPDNDASGSEGDSSDDDDDHDDHSGSANSWFYHPFHYLGNKFCDPQEENDRQPTQSLV